MPSLPDTPRLSDFQTYVKQLEEERGFTDQNVKDKCILIGEEVGELFKAIRKQEGLKIDENSTFSPVADELADIFIYLLSISNRYSIDLEKAFREKEIKNHQREWS